MLGFISPKLKGDRRNIQPADPIAREFIAPFCENLFQTIEKLSSGGDWTTNNKYPLSPYQLWEKHQDPNCFVGVRHGNETTYGALDIDKNSPYHLNQDETAIPRIKAALESIGLVRSQNTRSSNSGGLHIYFPLPEKVNTFKLACAIATALLNDGFDIAKGKLEIFPNIKPYSPNYLEPTHYNGLRLPLQQGGALVDDDGNYVSDEIHVWVSMWKTAAAGQDIQLLKRSLKNAKKPKGTTGSNIKGGAAKWQKDLLAMINNGWEPDSTQNMLHTIAIYHYVFDGLTDLDELTTAIAATAKTTKGFWEYSQHTHWIEKDSRNWAKWIINHPKYHPYESGKAIATAKTKKPKTSRLDEVKQALIDLLAEIGDRYFETTRSLAAYLEKQLKTSRTTLYKFQELWQHLITKNHCNAASSNKYSDFETTETTNQENTQSSEKLIESGVTVTAPNELLITDVDGEEAKQSQGNVQFEVSDFFKEISKPLPDNKFKLIMTFEQQVAIASTCKAEPIKIISKWHKPKEPPRENSSTLENIKAIVTLNPSKARSHLAMLKAKLLMPWLKVEERLQTEEVIEWVNDFIDMQFF